MNFLILSLLTVTTFLVVWELYGTIERLLFILACAGTLTFFVLAGSNVELSKREYDVYRKDYIITSSAWVPFYIWFILFIDFFTVLFYIFF